MNVINVHGRDIDKIVGEIQFAVVPLGSVEYHGPHSPLGTDIILANGFAERIDPVLRPLVYPTIAFTACPGKTQDYSGTVTVRPSVFIDYLSDIVEGICQLGIRNIVLLNAHDANMGPSRTVAEAVTGKYRDASFLLINWWQMATIQFSEQVGIFQGTTGRGHGGPYEMSAVKAFCPELVSVQESDLELDSSPPLSSLPYVLVEGTPDNWDGYTGRIQQTSLEAGHFIVEEAVKNMNLLMENWLEMRKGKNGEDDRQHGIS
ncbi:creatininase family protein [Paenibacillus frigoriresistens]|uniref:creatininase family protein n=1 Tax=Paenibacillus alginolyticus TaxID=59839 RepID=UPI00156363A4|nr:creatininase family protein [Paenibacillus frigoriresistens]NRF92018.1 creatininase family protein [Paenibacillus frigoriresistens]